MSVDSKIEIRRWHDWTDPDFFMAGRQSERRVVSLFLRQILPAQLQRTRLTLAGWMLVIVALGIGSAAYNTSSNILFMTLSLMLSSLVLSGVLSLINFKKLNWVLAAPEHLQVGEVGMAEIALENRKRTFPSMSLAFNVGHTGAPEAPPLYLKNALSAGECTSLEWTFTPERRGEFEVNLHGVESKFPFGFLLKTMGEAAQTTVLVWPARVEYSFSPLASGRRFLTGVSRRKVGMGSDLLSLRTYERGDAPRLIHWKATARMNRLMIRQFAQEGESGFNLWLDTYSAQWNAMQIETLCSVACALSEDLFHVGRLETVRVNGGELLAVRGLRELHEFFDTLAMFDQVSKNSEPTNYTVYSRRNMITFQPCGESGVTIHVNGSQAGQA